MDSDFEDEELRLPPALAKQSQNAKAEAQAAKDLRLLVAQLEELLTGTAFGPQQPVLDAVALVDAACRGSGPFYASQTWILCRGHRTSFEGRSFREMRTLAKRCLSALSLESDGSKYVDNDGRAWARIVNRDSCWRRACEFMNPDAVVFRILAL